MSSKPKLLFLYELSPELHTEDGLHTAIEILKDEFEITKKNIKYEKVDFNGFDFVLGHGGWGSNVDKLIKANREVINKCGLCIGGNINPPDEMFTYDALFCETNWYLPQIENHPNARVAFGINKNIFNLKNQQHKAFDYLGVGSFARWKRWEKMCSKKGTRLIVGEIQKDNPIESMAIVGLLVARGVGVMPNVDPESLSKLYHASDIVYLPAEIIGGSERAVLEARACGCGVLVEEDNPKLKELLTCEIPSAYDYAKQLSIGINKTL